MAALARTALRLLGQTKGNVNPALLFNSKRTYSSKGSLKEQDHDSMEKATLAAMMKNPRLREENFKRSSIEAFMQARMGVKRVLTDEELTLIGGDPNVLEPDRDMMEEFVDTIRGDMDTYDLANVELNEDSAKIIGCGKYNDPILVPCGDPQGRQIICYCEEFGHDTNMLVLQMGECRPCHCGVWYQLVDF